MNTETKQLINGGNPKIAAINAYTAHSLLMDDLIYAFVLISAELGSRMSDELGEEFINSAAAGIETIKKMSPEISKLADIIMENNLSLQEKINSTIKETLTQLKKGFPFSDKNGGTVIPEEVNMETNELKVTLTEHKTGKRITAIWNLEDVLMSFQIESYYFLEIANDGQIIHKKS